MKHLILVFLIVLTCYFAWHSASEKSKGTVKKLLSSHFFKLVTIVAFVWLAFLLQASFGSGKLF